MKKANIMSAAALKAMKHILNLEPTDRVLVITDNQTLDCGKAFAQGASNHGCPVTTFVLPEENRPLQETPSAMWDLLENCDVVINAIVGDSAEVPFRIQWLTAVEELQRVRMGHSPGIDADMMVEGPLNVDYGLMRERADKLIAAFDHATALQISTTAGTDLELDITDRTFVSDVGATVRVSVNLPCGEIYCAPVETGANGTLVVDGCFGNHGVVAAPLVMTIRQGRVIDVVGGNPAEIGIVNKLLDTDEASRSIAELGIGINPGARLTPRMLEAEKAFRTAHIAFGSNEGMPGGQNKSSMHIDYLFHTPTIKATWPDGHTRVVIEAGEFRI